MTSDMRLLSASFPCLVCRESCYLVVERLFTQSKSVAIELNRNESYVHDEIEPSSCVGWNGRLVVRHLNGLYPDRKKNIFKLSQVRDTKE